MFSEADMLLENAGFSLDEDLAMSDAGPEINELASPLEAKPEEPWRTVYSNEQLHILCRGNRKLTPHQEEQIEAAARLIELALK